MNKNPARYILFIAFFLILLLYLILYIRVPKQGFWQVDNANKFLQVQAFRQSNFQDASIQWAGENLNGDFKFSPLRQPFFIRYQDKWYSQYPPFFAFLSAFFFQLFKFWGLYSIPLAAGVGIFIILARIMKKLEMDEYTRCIGVLMAALASPLLFYSFTFWEHMPSVFFLLCAIFFLIGYIKNNTLWKLIAGGACAAFSIYFREELILFYSITIIGIFFLSKPENKIKAVIVFVSSFIIALLPLLLFNWWTIGNPFGFHLSSNIKPDYSFWQHVASRITAFYKLFLRGAPLVWLSLGMAAPFIFAYAIFPFLKDSSKRRFFPALGITAFLISLIIFAGFLFSGKPIRWLMYSNSLFYHAPILIFGFQSWKGREECRVKKFLWLNAIGFMLLYALLAPPISTKGIHWANRFFLPVYPLFIIFAAENITVWFKHTQNKKVIYGSCLLLAFFLSFALQLYSFELLCWKKDFSRNMNIKAVSYREKIIFTNVWWVSQELYMLFAETPLFITGGEASTPQEFTRFIRHLKSEGYETALFITESNPDAGGTTLEDEKLHQFSLQFIPIRLSE